MREKYVTDNVAMSMNLKKIKPRGQEILKFAACLGHSFSTEVLELVWSIIPAIVVYLEI